MMYIVHYFDDNHRQHMTFVKTYKDVEFIRDRFGEITVETFKIKQYPYLEYKIAMAIEQQCT